MTSRRRRIAGLVALLACCAAATARGDAIPGAAYDGRLPGDGTIQLRVSADGTRVVSYRVQNLAGDTCLFNAGGEEGAWEGAAITNRAFEYHLGESISLEGVFSGEQSATGTVRFYNYAVGSRPACDTGKVSWTATTESPPAPGSTPPGGSPGTGTEPLPPGGTNSSRALAKGPYRTAVSLGRDRSRRLRGRLVSASSSCRSRRRVVLKAGRHRVAEVASRADGSFRFRRLLTAPGRRVRATVSAGSRAGVRCGAGASRVVRA